MLAVYRPCYICNWRRDRKAGDCVPSRRFPGPVVISTQSFVRKRCLRFGSFCVRGPCRLIFHTARKHWWHCSKVVRGGGPSTAMFEPSERPAPPNRLQAQTWRKALACMRWLGAKRLHATASRQARACTHATRAKFVHAQSWWRIWV